MSGAGHPGHALPPVTEFAPVRSGRVAYQRFGSGEHIVVAIPPMAQNLELSWERPEIRAMLERLASFSTFIHFDKRGTGVSDRTMPVPGLDERVDDLRAVMDHAGVEHAHLFAQSEGGPMTLLFAATYPDRVDSVILLGSGARVGPDSLTDELRVQQMARRRTFSDKWGTPESEVVDLFTPSRRDDEEFKRWHQRYERLSASPDSLYLLMVEMLDMDVREVVPEITAPILVMHRPADPAMPAELGREVVALAPNAHYVEVSGIDHFAYLGPVEEWASEMERFVTGTVVERPDVGRVERHPARAEVLGRFAVTVDGADVAVGEWGSRQARTLLKRLVVSRGWPVRRDELIELLWPDADDVQRLGARLSVQLSAVRKVLGGGLIATREAVSLDRDHVRTDLDDFWAADSDSEIVDAYSGELLPDDVYEDWSRAARDEARARFRSAALAELAARDAAGEVGEREVGIAHLLLAADPYDDVGHEVLVRTLNTAGDRRGAHTAHEAWAAVRGELGLGPPDPLE